MQNNNMSQIMVMLVQETGEETKITLPLSSDRIKSLYAQNDWDLSKDFMVDPYSPPSIYEDVNPIGYLVGLQKAVSFQRLGLFTDKLASLDEEHLNQFESIARALCSSRLVDNKNVTLAHLFEHIYTLDDFMIAPNISNDEELGQFLVDNDFIEELPPSVDFEKIGKNHRIDTGGVFSETNGGQCYYESPNGLLPEQLTVNVTKEWEKLLGSDALINLAHHSLYRGTLEDAINNGEAEQYHKSYEQNRICRDTILEKFSTRYDGYRVPKTIIPDVIKEFGKERVQWILSTTIQLSLHDGRIDDKVKSWANNTHNPDSRRQMCGYMIDGHAGIVDIFAKQFQRIEKQDLQQEPEIQPEHSNQEDTQELGLKMNM